MIAYESLENEIAGGKKTLDNQFDPRTKKHFVINAIILKGKLREINAIKEVTIIQDL